MLHKHHVLIAEDDEATRAVLSLMLEDDFVVTLANDGNQALTALKSTAFHFVILDVHLPIIDGLKLCKAVQAMPPERRPGIMMLSGDLSDDTVKQAFSLGASDFIGKPFNVVAFHQRVMRFDQDITKIRALELEDSRKRSLAEMAMKQASSYGSGLDLLARLNQCFSVEAFFQQLTQGLLAHGFHCAVEFRHGEDCYHYDVDSVTCSDNEKKVFQLLRDQGRIYQFGRRTIFNEPTCSLLIKNMPTEGTVSYDAAIDLFAKLVPALGGRFSALMHMQTIERTRGTLNEMISMVGRVILDMERERKQKLESIAALIGVSFHELDMTEAQEKFFMDLTEKQLNTENSNDQFQQVITLLTECAAKLDEGLNAEQASDLTSADFDDDIELF